MTLFTILPFAAAGLSLLLAVASVLRKKPTPATWCFFAGMLILGIDSLFTGLSLLTTDLSDALRWLTLALVAKAFVPAAWLGFSLTYSRGDYRASLARWRVPLAILALLPIGLALGFRDQLLEVVLAGPQADVLQLRFGAAARALNVLLLVAFALVLMNLEQTFRSAVGTMRWRIKFVVLGLAVIFGAHLYVRSQAILFSAHDMALSGVESSGLLIGCLLLALAYARTGLAEADVYPSRAVLRSSLTVLIVGGYLFIVGVLAQVVRLFGGAESFQFQAFVVLLGMAGLAVLLLSDRLRQRIHGFVVRHFGKAQHDSVQLWTGFSRRLAKVRDEAGLCAASAKLVSETFEVLSVAIWLVDEQKERLTLGASTAQRPDDAAAGSPAAAVSSAVAAGLRARPSPFDLEAVNEAWAEELRRLNPTAFAGKGGNRWCVPLSAGEQVLGALVLADRVNASPYTAEELELLKCIGDQFTSVLLNLRLANEVVQARELEAFRTMSAFFVHDLKNAAASLNLMLKNLPAPLRQPGVQGGRPARRREHRPAHRRDDRAAERPAAAARLQAREDGPERAGLRDHRRASRNCGACRSTVELRPLPPLLADREQLRSVVTNLLINARDALGRRMAGIVGAHGTPGRPRRAVGRGQRLRHERGVREGLAVPAVPEHQEGRARHRDVPVADDRGSARGEHPGGDRGRQGHDVPRDPPCRD